MRKSNQVGGSLREAARRVASAWRRAERGEAIAPQDNVTFVSWSALAAAMTDKRHELLRHLHRQPAPSIRALAAVGLVEKRGSRLRADYDEIRAVIRMKDAAA